MNLKLQLVVAGLLLSPVVATAQGEAASQYAPSASKTLYEFNKYSDFEILKYFKELNDAGRKFPTAQEFKDRFGVDVEFVRSHVKKRAVLTGDKNQRLFPNLREGRTLTLLLSLGTNKMSGGYPSGDGNNDVWTLWQYADFHGSWNHGLFQSPAAWVDAAHKHGVDMGTGIKFFDTTGGRGIGASPFIREFMAKDDQGNYLYVKPLIHVLMFLGHDGLTYNWEADGYTDDVVKNFNKQLYQYAQECGFTNLRNAIYTGVQTLPNAGYEHSWLKDTDSNTQLGDIMLNYNGDDFADINGNSGKYVNQTYGSYDHVYSGAWIVSMNRSWSQMEQNNTNLYIWGEHSNSRFYSYNDGETTALFLKNLQELQERAFSGGNRNPAVKNRWTTSDWGDRLRNFGGISRMISERTTLEQNLPFQTFFNTGVGERYFYKGKSASTGPWYNMGAQDLQPTYRWLQYLTGTKTPVAYNNDVQVEYNYQDAYTGGSALRFFGNGGVDIILYRGLLTVSGANPTAKLAFKTRNANTQNHLSLLLHKKGAADTDYIVVDFDNLQGTSWEEQTKNITGLNTGDIIDYVGIRMASGQQDILLGELGLFDSSTSAKPSTPFNLKAEIKEESLSGMSALLSWEVLPTEGVTPTRASYGMVYNDEAGVDHFEVFYKNGANGKVIELGRTTTWATYVPTINFTKEKGVEGAEEPWIGVRAVGKDLKTATDIVWLEVEREDSFRLPEPDPYCKSFLDPASEGANTARRIRFLSEVSTTGAVRDIHYTSQTPDLDGDNYVYAKDQNLVVRQGQTINFKFVGYGNPNIGSNTRDGLQFCWAATYIDWDKDGSFNGEPGSDEKIEVLTLGTARSATPAFQAGGVTKTFQIPNDAKPGKTRVRIVFTDAWAPIPTPCAHTNKGFTFDFNMTIEGENPARVPFDRRDQGEVEDNVTTPVETVQTDSHIGRVFPTYVTSVLNLENVDQIWIYAVDGGFIRSAKGVSQVNLSDLPKGVYLVKAETNHVTRTHKIVKE